MAIRKKNMFKRKFFPSFITYVDVKEQITAILERERRLVSQLRCDGKKALRTLHDEYVTASPELDELVLQQNIEAIEEARANPNMASLKRLEETYKSTQWLFARGVPVDQQVLALRAITLKKPDSAARAKLLAALAEILVEV